MEPFNFEDDVRKKLQEREIAPSEGAWAKLDAQLASTNAYKKNKFPWLALAASFVGILIVASAWFSQSAGDASTDVVLEDTTKPEPLNTPDVRPQNTLIKDATVIRPDEQTEIAIQEVPEKEKATPTKIPTSPAGKFEEKIMMPKTTERSSYITDAVAKNELPKTPLKQTKQLKIEERITPQTIESEAIAQVVAQVKAIQNKQGVITSESVDLLLSQARKKLQTERMLSSSKIDPAALLQDVEMDLEESFRNKVFDALGTGFEIIRTAVVERNN